MCGNAFYFSDTASVLSPASQRARAPTLTPYSPASPSVKRDGLRSSSGGGMTEEAVMEPGHTPVQVA